jgi:hypothetical protein
MYNKPGPIHPILAAGITILAIPLVIFTFALFTKAMNGGEYKLVIPAYTAPAPETTAAPIETTQPVAEAPPPEAKWRKVKTFKGEQNKNTETFGIAAQEWRISWAADPGRGDNGNFGLMLYTEAGSMQDSLANIIGKGSESTMERGAGQYYLTIVASEPYAIVVEEYR